MNGRGIDSGETLTVVRYQESEKGKVGTTGNNLYVKNFPRSEFEEADLYEMFSKYGEISNTAIMRDENLQSKRFGFVCFKNQQDA